MKFSSKEDLALTIERSFQVLSDFEAFERLAMRHGAAVTRMMPADGGPVGTRWDIQAKIRGKTRPIELELVTYQETSLLTFVAKSKDFEGEFILELTELSENKTQMRVALEVKAKTLAARLMLQSGRLTKKTLNNRYKLRVANFAEDIEQKYAL